jgi:threonine aldolase
VGSALVGPREKIEYARRLRKALGGGWRQAGILAAAAIHALDHHVERLAEDHANAKLLAEAVRATPGLSLEPAEVDTNIIIFRVEERLGTAAEVCRRLAERGVRMYAISPGQIRAVFHLDVSAEDARRACEELAAVAN